MPLGALEVGICGTGKPINVCVVEGVAWPARAMEGAAEGKRPASRAIGSIL